MLSFQNDLDCHITQITELDREWQWHKVTRNALHRLNIAALISAESRQDKDWIYLAPGPDSARFLVAAQSWPLYWMRGHDFAMQGRPWTRIRDYQPYTYQEDYHVRQALGSNLSGAHDQARLAHLRGVGPGSAGSSTQAVQPALGQEHHPQLHGQPGGPGTTPRFGAKQLKVKPARDFTLRAYYREAPPPPLLIENQVDLACYGVAHILDLDRSRVDHVLAESRQSLYHGFRIQMRDDDELHTAVRKIEGRERMLWRRVDGLLIEIQADSDEVLAFWQKLGVAPRKHARKEVW